VFTKEPHPASPAVLCRLPVGDHGESQIQSRCLGEKAACDDFIAAAIEGNSRNDWTAKFLDGAGIR
jgi:hypothetical protein